MPIFINTGKWSEEEIIKLKNNIHLKPNQLKDIFTHRPIKSIRDKRYTLKQLIKKELKEYFNDIPLETRAYLAGHFDGEGCIRFLGRQNRTPAPRVKIQACCVETLLLYQSYFGGKVKPIRHKLARKQLYSWELCRYNDIFNLCKTIIPFSIEKAPQINVVLSHFEDWLKEPNCSHPFESFTKRSIERAEECRRLKHVGLAI